MVRFSDDGERASAPEIDSGADLAPVIPLFASDRGAVAQPAATRWASTWDDDDDDVYDEGDVIDECDAIERDIAERTLLKRLRTRSLSVREARAVVAERDLDEDAIEGLVQSFVRRGYLDDARLADQLIHIAVERKRHGRQAVARALSARGIPQDTADAALAELPDDDSERAFEYARGKAGAMRGLERDVALRRLAGQLARRGYSGSVALSAARAALEAAHGSSGVRFD